MFGAVLTAVAAVSSSADLAAAAAAAAARQTRLGISSPGSGGGAAVTDSDPADLEGDSFEDSLQNTARVQGQPVDSKNNGGVAGVQISMLYPGTLGSTDFDYHVGDRIVTP